MSKTKQTYTDDENGVGIRVRIDGALAHIELLDFELGLPVQLTMTVPNRADAIVTAQAALAQLYVNSDVITSLLKQALPEVSSEPRPKRKPIAFHGTRNCVRE